MWKKYTKQSVLQDLTSKQKYEALQYIGAHKGALMKDYYGTKKAQDWQMKYQAVMFLRDYGLVEVFRDNAPIEGYARYQYRMRLTDNGKKVLKRLRDIEALMREATEHDEEGDEEE